MDKKNNKINSQDTWIDPFYLNDLLSEEEKSIQKNDVNFLVGINLLNAWHNSNTMHKKWLAIMKNNKNNIYPPLSEQNFLYNKGDYLKYYEKKGVPIAPTFLIKKNRDPKKIIAEVKKNKWNGFVVKPDYAFANIEISKYEMDDKDVEKKLSKYLMVNINIMLRLRHLGIYGVNQRVLVM